MANRKITGFTAAGALTGGELVPVVRAGNTDNFVATAQDIADLAEGGTAPVIQMACSDLTTPIIVGTDKAYCRSPSAFTLVEARASLLTASTSGDVTVDILVNGSSILSTKITIPEGETTSLAGSAPVISSPAIADDDIISVEVEGAGTGAAGLIATLIGI